MEVLLAQPRGFCAGVDRAIAIVNRALAVHGRPVYVYHEIVHNGHVVESLRARGAIFVDDIDAIPPHAVTIFSAHGVSNEIAARAARRELNVIDATCPLVAKVHAQVGRYARAGRAIILIGHAGHDEVEGTRGSVDVPVHVVCTPADIEALRIPEGASVAYATQTTLSLDDTAELIALLERKYPGIEGPALDDICYATQNRQNAVRALAERAQVVIVVGSRNSSNTHRLREVAEQRGAAAYLVQDASEIDAAWVAGVMRVGVTAGASVPEALVRGVEARLIELGAVAVCEMEGPAEVVKFRLPPIVADTAASDRAIGVGRANAR